MNFLLALTLFTVGFIGVAPRKADYNDIRQVRGTAIFLNHPDLGRTPCANCYFVVRSEEAKNVGIGFRTDPEGKFELYLSLGKWKLLPVDSCVDCGSGVYDLVAEHQKRTFEVGPTRDTLQFDIELKFKRTVKP